jgi:hypothetical protein
VTCTNASIPRLKQLKAAIAALPAQIRQQALQPAPYARAVTAVDITELALEIGFLAGHHAVADDEREGHQHRQLPDIVERDRQPDKTQEHGEVDGLHV